MHKQKLATLVTSIAMTLTTMLPAIPIAQAAQFNKAGLVFGNVTASQSYNGTPAIFVYFMPTTALSTNDTLTVTFTGEGGQMSNVAADYTITLGGPVYEGVSPTNAPINTTPTAVDGTAKTFQVTLTGAADTATLYAFKIVPANAKFQNPPSGQMMNITTSVGDSSNVFTSFIANTQVQTSASVAPYFSLGLTSFNQSLGSIAQGGTNLLTKGSNTTVTVISNAINGWSTMVYDDNNGLKSTRDATVHGGRTAIANATIGGVTATNSVGTVSKGLFGIQVANGTGATVVVNYTTTNAGGIALENVGGLSNTSINEVAYRTDVSNANTGDTLTINPAVVTTAITPAANDYSDVIHVVASGLY